MMSELEKLLEKIEGNETFGKTDGDLIRNEIKKRNDEAGENRKELSELVSLMKTSLGVDTKNEIKDKVNEFKGNETQYNIDLSLLKKEVETMKTENKIERDAKQKAIADKTYLENYSAIKKVLSDKNIKKDDYFIKGLMSDINKSEEFGLLVGKDEKLDDFIQRTLIDEVSTVDNKKDVKEKANTDRLLTKEQVSNMGFAEYKENKEVIQKSKASWK